MLSLALISMLTLTLPLQQALKLPLGQVLKVADTEANTVADSELTFSDRSRTQLHSTSDPILLRNLQPGLGRPSGLAALLLPLRDNDLLDLVLEDLAVGVGG